MLKLCVLLLLAVGAYAQVDSALQNSLLSLHNKYRANVKPTPITKLSTLSWDLDLAKKAQKTADTCKRAYSPWKLSIRHGETIYYGANLNITAIESQLAAHGADYDYFSASCLGYLCEHHVQVTAAKVTSIGCGRHAACKDATTGETFDLVVCNFNKHAAFSGVNSYKTSETDPEAELYEDEGDTQEDAPDYDWVNATSAETGITEDPDAVEYDSDADTSATSKRQALRAAWNGKSSIDYRKTKLVTKIVNQGSCGSCWTFATAAVVEGAYAIAKGKRSVPLSQQQVLDCTPPWGCKGGWPYDALEKIRTSGGLTSAAKYRYVTKQTKCKKLPAVAKVSSWGKTAGNKKAMLDALSLYGPTVIYVEADAKFKSYKKGVMRGTYKKINHAITLVGYNHKKKFYIVRNSWGTSWGIGGYGCISTAKPMGMQLYGSVWARG